MISFNDITKKEGERFKEIVDEMLLMDNDDQTKEGIEFIDEFAMLKGKDFYWMMLNLYVLEEIKDLIKQWEVDKCQKKNEGR